MNWIPAADKLQPTFIFIVIYVMSGPNSVANERNGTNLISRAKWAIAIANNLVVKCGAPYFSPMITKCHWCEPIGSNSKVFNKLKDFAAPMHLQNAIAVKCTHGCTMEIARKSYLGCTAYAVCISFSSKHWSSRNDVISVVRYCAHLFVCFSTFPLIYLAANDVLACVVRFPFLNAAKWLATRTQQNWMH